MVFSRIIFEYVHSKETQPQVNGNAVRSLVGAPSVGPTNLYIVPGIIHRGDHLEYLKWFYVTEMIGFGVNIVTGDYSEVRLVCG